MEHNIYNGDNNVRRKNNICDLTVKSGLDTICEGVLGGGCDIIVGNNEQ